MHKLFVDTSAWIAAVDGNEKDHLKICKARDNWLETSGILVTSDYIIDETLTLMRMRFGLPVAREWWQLVENSTRLQIEWITPERAIKAREFFFKYYDKNFSFTDCTSFVLMREKKINDVLTLDKHFAQNGFTALPK